MRYHVANGMGDSLDDPTESEMRAFLAAIDEKDEEHGAAWLSVHGGASLEWNGDGRLVYSREQRRPVVSLIGITRERALELWLALVHGDAATLESQPWKPGNGFVMTPEREAERNQWALDREREFIDSRGPEVGDPCREPGCARKTITHSIHCRKHHFEAWMKRPFPLEE